MKPFLRTLLLTAGLALGTSAATAAPWADLERGDLLLGVQASGGTGATTNLFFNLGPAHLLRDNPNPAGVIVNLDAALDAAFGTDWATRPDLYFGVFANRSASPSSGLGAAAPENGDPSRTIYASRGTTVAGTSLPWTGFTSSGLGLAANNHQGQVSGNLPALNNTAGTPVPADGNEIATLTQAGQPVPWNNSWTAWNGFLGGGAQAPAFGVFTGGIQAQFADNGDPATSRAKVLDVYRILGTTGEGSYVTSVTLADNGELTIASASGATNYYNVTATAVNGTVEGAGADIEYADGSNAVLRAVPNPGFAFSGWGGDAAGTQNPLTLAIDGDKNVTANFVALPTIGSPTATDIVGDAATLGADVTNAAGTLSARGVVLADFAANSNPLIGQTGVTDLPVAGPHAVGVFTVAASSLTPGTTYAYKGYATNAAGTAYTSVARFTTDTEITFTGGVGTLPNRQILGGDSHGFTFTLANAAQANFTSTGAAGLDWELRDASDQVVANGSGNLAISELLDAGAYRLVFGNPGATTETFSLNLDGSATAAPRPDISVGPNAAAPIGANAYAGVQRATIIARRAAPRNGFANVDNDGAQPTAIRFQARRGNSLFRVSYLGPGGNITAQAIGAGFQTPVLAQGDAAIGFRARVIPNRRKLVRRVGRRTRVRRAVFTSTVRATAVVNPGLSDVGQLQFRVQ